jgi:hypothetical protein
MRRRPELCIASLLHIQRTRYHTTVLEQVVGKLDILLRYDHIGCPSQDTRRTICPTVWKSIPYGIRIVYCTVCRWIRVHAVFPQVVHQPASRLHDWQRGVLNVERRINQRHTRLQHRPVVLHGDGDLGIRGMERGACHENEKRKLLHFSTLVCMIDCSILNVQNR